METTRYNINGNETTHDITECIHCGHQVNVQNIRHLEINGLISGVDGWMHDTVNPLMVLDKLSTCCDKPEYHFINCMHLFKD